LNKLYLTLIIATLLFGIIFVTGAGELIVSKFTKTVELDKTQRDYLLAKLPVTMEKGQPLPNEIKPVITIDCNHDYCKWSAVQTNLIQSYDNIIDKKYCVEMGNGTICKNFDEKGICLEYEQVCIKEVIYTITEIEEQVTAQVSKRLSDYANESIKSDLKPYIKTSEGTLEITAK